MAQLLYVGAFAMAWSMCSAAHTRCLDGLPPPAILLNRAWTQHGATSVELELPVSHEDLLVSVDTRGIDVELDSIDPSGMVVHLTANPVDRSGLQVARLGPALAAHPLRIRATQSAKFVGTIHIRVLRAADATASSNNPAQDCLVYLQKLSEADAAFAEGQSITSARIPSNTPTGHVVPPTGHDPEGGPRTVSGVARASFEHALAAYKQALDSLSRTSPNSDRADAELAIAALYYYELQNWSEAATWATRASASFTADADPYLRARSNAILAAAWLELATQSTSTTKHSSTPGEARIRLDRARSLLASLQRFHASRAERYDEALQINNIGVAYIYEARFEPAIPYLSRARDSFEALGDPARAAVAMQNLAICEWGLGHLSAALIHFDRALLLMGPAPYPDLYLLTLNNSGLAHYAAGQLDRSLQLQMQALDFATLSQADRARARSYYGMGVAYYAIGDRELASQFLRSALQICTPKLDARIRVASLRALAVIDHEQGHLTDAVSHNSEALRLASAPSARARILLRLALDHAALGETAEALRLLTDLIDRPPNGDGLVRAIARTQRGALLRGSGSLDAAEADLVAALRSLKKFESLAERFDAQVELARLRADRGQRALALTTVQQALDLSREIRLQTANPEYRASIVQSLRPALELDIDLMRANYEDFTSRGNAAAARSLAYASLQAVDESRALEFENWRAEQLPVGVDKHVASLLSTSSRLYLDMAERRFQLSTREDRAGADDPRAEILRQDIARMRVQLGLINSELATLTSGALPEHLRATGGGLPSVSAQAGDWAARFRTLPSGTVLLEYLLGSQRAYGWAVDSTDIRWVALAPVSAIDRLVARLHSGLRSPGNIASASRLEDASTLYRMTVEPLSELAGHAVNLTIVPDGSLHYMPFGALRDSSNPNKPYLVQHSVISIAPALRLVSGPLSFNAASAEPIAASQPSSVAASNSLSQRTPASNRMLLVADPVYTSDDARLHVAGSAPALATSSYDPSLSFRTVRGDESLARLPATGREATRIQSEYGPDQVDLLSGLDATRRNFLSRNLAEYRFIHIASHGVVDAEIPQLSALVLGKFARDSAVSDPYVRAGDFLTRTFNAQAIVLSACDTALGKAYSGEGLVGLRYAALARGARSVVASLWPVSDGIASDLMTYMYEQIKENDAAKATHSVRPSEVVSRSLTAAMRHVLDQTPSLDPAIWAPFTVYVAGD